VANVLLSYTDVLGKEDAKRLRKLEKLILQYDNAVSKIPTKHLKKLGWSDYSGARKWKSRKDKLIVEHIENDGSKQKQTKYRRHDYKPKKEQKISRRTTYGKIEPTFKRVDIQTLDQLVEWIKTYTPYMRGKWDNANTRENARIMFFDVFKNGMSKMVGKPRDSGKSKVAVGVFCCILANYWLPQSIIINGPKAKSRIFNGIKKVIKSNKFREDYGDIIEFQSKQEGYMELYGEFMDSLVEDHGYVTDDPAIQISMYNGIVGSHPFVVWLEDMLQSEFKNEESNDYMLYEVYDAIIDKLADRKGGTFTRKGLQDLYSQLPDRNILLITRKAIELIKGKWPTVDDLIRNEEGHVIDVIIDEQSEFKIIERPGWTIKNLLIRRTMALLSKRAFEMWEREMQNNPILSEGAYFDKKDWKLVDNLPFEMIKGNCYVAVDPSFGKKEKSDFFAVIIGTPYKGRLLINKIDLKKGVGFNDAVNYLRWIQRTYNPMLIEIEAVFWQALIATEANRSIPNLIANRRYKEKDKLNVKTNKIERIDTLDIPFATNKIVIARNAGDEAIKNSRNKLTMMEEAYNQFISYDRTDSTDDRKDDFLDALQMLYERTKYYLSSLKQYTKTWNSKR
jgi:hypothetical protein